MRKFDKPVKWEFNTRIQGTGRNVREAYLDALEQAYETGQTASDFVMEAVEKNELWLVDGKFPNKSTAEKGLQDSTARCVPYELAEKSHLPLHVIFVLVLVFVAASLIFFARYTELQRACLAKGNSAEYCWDLGR